jgi:CDGSH-type Zn-finger protein
VDVNAADADAIANTIETCPTGALHYRRVDGQAPRQAPVNVTIEPRLHGPLFVRGPVRVVDAGRRVVREGSRLARCRCGASASKPFCDGRHRRIRFEGEHGTQ